MNPFNTVYEAAIERGESEHSASKCAKVLYADYVHYLYDNDHDAKFVLDKLAEYSRQLNDVLYNR